MGTGPGDDDHTVTVQDGATISVGNANAITVGDNADITVQGGALVTNAPTVGGRVGAYRTGFDTIELNSNGAVLIEEGGSVVQTGSATNAEAINIEGFGNTVENHGLIQTPASAAAIWFEDTEISTDPADRNVVDNFGTIERIGGAGSVIGSNQGAGIVFINRTGAEVIGGISFGGGDDDLTFEAGSLVTGPIDGGGGTNNLFLDGVAGSDDTLAGAIRNFSILTKRGEGRWEISGTLAGIDVTTVEQGTLALTGDNTNYSGEVFVEPAGILEARARSLPTQTVPEDNVDNVFNDGVVHFTQPDDGTYIGQIVGTGEIWKTGGGTLTLAPLAAEGNTYSGGTTLFEGILAVGADSALGAPSGPLTFDGGTLRFDDGFDLSPDRLITIDSGNGTIDTQDFTSTIAQGITGDGHLTKIGPGTLILNNSANDYAGGTSVAEGTLAVGDAGSPDAALTGGGDVEVASGAALGGYGTVVGDVTNDGTIAVANATPEFVDGPNGDFTIEGDLLNSSLVAVGGAGIGNRLVVMGDYVGNGGTVALNTFLGPDDSPSDLLVVDGGTASGASFLDITNVGGLGGLTLQNGIMVIEATGGATTGSDAFALAGPVAAGAFEYVLFRGGVTGGTEDNWYLRSTVVAPPPDPDDPDPDVPPPPPPPQPAPGSPVLPVPPAPGAPPPAPPTPGATPGSGPDIPLYRPEVPVYSIVPPVVHQLALATLGTFHERKGEQGLLTNDGPASAAWGRVFGQRTERSWSGTVTPSFDGAHAGLQAGLDVFARQTETGHRDHVGVFIGHARLDGDVKGFALGWNDLAVGDVELDGTSLGAYWTHIGPGEWYVDAVALATWFNGAARSNRGVGVDVDGTGLTLSLEGGYPFALTPEWTLEPQAQFVWQTHSLDDTRDMFSPVSLDADDGFTGRVGARLQGEFQTEAALVRPYLKANVWHEFSGASDVVFGTDVISTERETTTLEIGAGIAVASLTDRFGVYAHVDYSTNLDGEDLEALKGGLGVRFAW